MRDVIGWMIVMGLFFGGPSILEKAKELYYEVFLGQTEVSVELYRSCEYPLSLPRFPGERASLVSTVRGVVEGGYLPINRDVVVTVNQDRVDREPLTVGVNGYNRAGIDHGLVRIIDQNRREIDVSISSRQTVSPLPQKRELTIQMNCLGITPEGEKFFAAKDKAIFGRR